MALEDLIRKLEEVTKPSNVFKSIEIVEEDSRFRTPIDTGFLQNSTNIIKKGNVYTLFYDCEYGIYVHEILHYNHPYGEAKFLERAWNAKKGEFYESLLKPLKG
jgi:hypothetical protein